MDWKDIGRSLISKGAPLLGGVLGGPAGAAAGKMVAGMAVKAAEIFNGAHILGEVAFMAPEEVDRIHNRLDEQYRREQLRLT